MSAALVRALDALAFSSLWVAAAAGALCAVGARALEAPNPAAVVGLASCGTLVVYIVDRLRDLDRDRETAPLRTAFVTAHRGLLAGLAGAALLVCAGLAWRIGAWVGLLLAPVLVVGLLHRRLKRFAIWKPAYVTAAWVSVVVGLPAGAGAAAGGLEPGRVGWVAALVGATILANVIASNVRDGEAAAIRLGPQVPIRLAQVLAASGVAGGLLAPVALRPLALVPLATLAALVAFHPGERYGHGTVDGALLLGALGALPLL